MFLAFLKVVAASILISFVSWLSNRSTALAGFLTALPLTTLIALGFSHAQWKDPQQSVEYAKSILIAVPASLLFFVPFLFADRLKLGFWSCYGIGIGLLFVGYLAHSQIVKYL